MSDKQRSVGKIVDFSAVDASVQELIRQAVEVRKRAYNPYSGFAVGAALRCEDLSVVTGCNVENGAHGSICAERSAVVSAVSQGKRKFLAVAIVADKDRKHDEFVAPCGPCRQFIVEFGTATEIYLCPPEMDQVLITEIRDILPLHFTLRD